MRTPFRNCGVVMSSNASDATHPDSSPTNMATATTTGNITVEASTRGTTR